MYIKSLTTPLDLFQNSIPHHLRLVLQDIGLHRQAVLRGSFNKAQVAHPSQRHLQGTRNRCSGHGDHIHIGFEHFDLFFMSNPKALFLIDHQQPQILEDNILGKKPVSADDHIYHAFL